jgi:hypothetical protein
LPSNDDTRITELLELLKSRGQNIHQFDDLEIVPMQWVSIDGRTWEEESDRAEDTSHYTVFGHLASGGRDTFKDFPSELDAETYAALLIATFPHLAGEEYPNDTNNGK